MADWSLTSLQLKLIKIGAASCATPAPSRSSWLRSRCPVLWCAPSSPPFTDFERRRHARDSDPDPDSTKAAA
jgi:hypothetical protein